MNIVDTFSKSINTSNFLQPVQWGSDVIRGQRQTDTDTTKQMAGFRNFATAPKNVLKRLMWTATLSVFPEWG